MNELITSFVRATPGVAHAVVAGPDGRLLGCSDPLPPDIADEAAAVVSLLQSVARGAARFFRAEPVTRTVVTMDQGLLLLMAIRDGVALAVFAEPDTDFAPAAHFAGRLAWEVTGG